MVGAVIAAGSALYGVVQSVYVGEMAADVIDLVGPSKADVEGHEENKVSRALDTIISGMDTFGDHAAGLRDTAGKAVHDAVSKVPLIGGLLGRATDALGMVVDAGGAVYGDVVGTVGATQHMSNIVGAKFFGMDYVESEAEAVKGLSDEQKEDMSAMEILRSEGFINGSMSLLGRAASSIFGPGDAQGDGAGVEMPAWAISLDEGVSSGAVSDQDASSILGAYAAGAITDDVLEDYAQQVEQGSAEWGLLGHNLEILGQNLLLSQDVSAGPDAVMAGCDAYASSYSAPSADAEPEVPSQVAALSPGLSMG